MAQTKHENLNTIAAMAQRAEALEARGIDPYSEDDTVLGAFVYCVQHVRPHSTGWCTVHNADKIALTATDIDAAIAEVRAHGWRIFGEA